MQASEKLTRDVSLSAIAVTMFELSDRVPSHRIHTVHLNVVQHWNYNAGLTAG